MTVQVVVVQVEAFAWKVAPFPYPVLFKPRVEMASPTPLEVVAVLPLKLMVIYPWVQLLWMDTTQVPCTSPSDSTNAINFSSGTITFDTTHGYWHHTSGVHGTGVIEAKEDDGLAYKTCTFTFDSINLGSGLR